MVPRVKALSSISVCETVYLYASPNYTELSNSRRDWLSNHRRSGLGGGSARHGDNALVFDARSPGQLRVDSSGAADGSIALIVNLTSPHHGLLQDHINLVAKVLVGVDMTKITVVLGGGANHYKVDNLGLPITFAPCSSAAQM